MRLGQDAARCGRVDGGHDLDPDLDPDLDCGCANMMVNQNIEGGGESKIGRGQNRDHDRPGWK